MLRAPRAFPAFPVRRAPPLFRWMLRVPRAFPAVARGPRANSGPRSFKGPCARPLKREFAAVIRYDCHKGERQQVEPRTARRQQMEPRTARGQQVEPRTARGQMVSIKVFSMRVNSSTPSRKIKIVSAIEMPQ